MDKDAHLEELTNIRKLMVMALLRDGMTQKQVAAALDVDRSQISRMFPSGMLKGLAKGDLSD